ncbi:hypothetical protein FIBSPDRAFT_878046, partial [Athelia psychrophila]
MALALAQSLEESKADRPQLTAEEREEEEFARALEESRIMAGFTSVPVEIVSLPDKSPSHVPALHKRSIPSSPLPSSSHLGDNANGAPRADEYPFTSSPQMLNTQMSDDEALARQLASGGNSPPSPGTARSAPPNRIVFPTPQIPGSDLPLYSPSISSIVSSPETPATRLSVSSNWTNDLAESADFLSRHNSVRSHVSQSSEGRSRLSVQQEVNV